MTPDVSLTDEAFLGQIKPVVAQLLATEQATLTAEARSAILRQTLLTSLAIRRRATKQRLNTDAFARRIAREQATVWLAQRGSVSQQTHAMSQIMANNRDAVARYLSRHQFRTSAVVDEVVSDTFSAFYEKLAQHRPVEALLSTCLISIARNKAFHQHRHDRSAKSSPASWLETIILTVNESDIGTFEWPLLPGVEADDELVYELPPLPGQAGPQGVSMQQLRQWLIDCLATALSGKRQLLIQYKHRFLTERDLETISLEDLEKLFSTTDMDDIAQSVGYTNAHTASVRLNESHTALRKCIDQKRQPTLA